MISKLKKCLMKNKISRRIYMGLAYKRRYLQFKYFYVHTIKTDFKKKLGYNIDLKNPKTFNEKLQWLKVNYRNPITKEYADKYTVRTIIAKEFGDVYLNEVYGVYNSSTEIPFDKLPLKFVMKPTHSSGRIVICENKNNLNKTMVKRKLNKWLKLDYFYQGGEWVYKNLKPQIICEKYLGESIKDYKVYCFNGKPLFTQVISNRNKLGYYTNYFDMKWQEIDIKREDTNRNIEFISKPETFDEMIRISAEISSKFPFVRVDFYEIDKKLIFGEVTFYPLNGFIKFKQYEDDLFWGELLNLQN